jgi:hypothetical protein
MLAYLDPATGGMILQAAAAAIAGVAVTARLYWGRIKRVLRPRRSDAAADENAG